MNYGLQMYSLRDITGDDLEKGLRAASEIGYKMVEFAGFFGHPAEVVKGWLDKYGLTAIGTHTGAKAFLEDFDGIVAYHKTIGCKYLIIPGHDLSTKAKLDEFIAMVNEYQPKLEAEGITLMFHNHFSEFHPNRDGIIVHDRLVKETKLMFEIDTYWAFVAKRDPVEVITRLKDRIKLIHLKDGSGGRRGFSLGLGAAPVEAVRQTAIKLGFDMVVESEGCEPDGISEVTRCFEYLKTLD